MYYAIQRQAQEQSCFDTLPFLILKNFLLFYILADPASELLRFLRYRRSAGLLRLG